MAHERVIEWSKTLRFQGDDVDTSSEEGSDGEENSDEADFEQFVLANSGPWVDAMVLSD